MTREELKEEIKKQIADSVRGYEQQIAGLRQQLAGARAENIALSEKLAKFERDATTGKAGTGQNQLSREELAPMLEVKLREVDLADVIKLDAERHGLTEKQYIGNAVERARSAR